VPTAGVGELGESAVLLRDDKRRRRQGIVPFLGFPFHVKARVIIRLQCRPEASLLRVGHVCYSSL
jgi:hypothetical protein